VARVSHNSTTSIQVMQKGIFSNIFDKQRWLMKKQTWFASARGSAILATLTEDISKLSGPRWIQKVDNLKSSRRNVSEIKLKRTDTTLDLSQKATERVLVSVEQYGVKRVY
jgi:hypothetical protein